MCFTPSRPLHGFHGRAKTQCHTAAEAVGGSAHLVFAISLVPMAHPSTCIGACHIVMDTLSF